MRVKRNSSETVSVCEALIVRKGVCCDFKSELVGYIKNNVLQRILYELSIWYNGGNYCVGRP